MSTLETDILDAALRVFSRYGVKRTSMSDLCKEAGVSRQSLYNRFRNKDDILCGLIARYTDRAIEQTTRQLQGLETLGDRLDLVFHRMVVDGYDIACAMPNAQDFIDGVNAASEEALECSAARFRSIIAEVLAPHEAALARSGLTVAELADFIQRAAKAAATHTRDRAHFMTQLRTLRQLCVSAASTDAPDLSHSKESTNGHRQ